MTRSEYLISVAKCSTQADRDKLFREYYGQYVDLTITLIVKKYFTEEVIVKNHAGTYAVIPARACMPLVHVIFREQPGLRKALSINGDSDDFHAGLSIILTTIEQIRADRRATNEALRSD
ncbi:MAG: hypothetical protein JWO15_3529 [Sphingomonadales bacterium]|nr:hypothetical protein [Sphingomonadales bacterium]